MKPLIRPFLFTVARLGLFLAVAGWVVGNWWYMCWRIPGHYAIESDYCGWSFSETLGSGYLNLGFRIYSVPHWPFISAFLAFNVLLHVIYRKRPEAKPCED